MKKLLLISALCFAATGFAYASSSQDCDGTSKLVHGLNLDGARAYEVEQILKSYKEVKDLATSGRHDDIPAFLEERHAQLSQVLTEEEFQKFKENLGDWASNMDFSKFGDYARKTHGRRL